MRLTELNFCRTKNIPVIAHIQMPNFDNTKILHENTEQEWQKSGCRSHLSLFLCTRALADLFDGCVPCHVRHVLGCFAHLKVVQLLKIHLETPFCLIMLPGTSPQNMKMAFKAWIDRMIGNPLLLHLHMGQETRLIASFLLFYHSYSH